MATVPNLQNVGASIAARLSALENNNGFVTQEALDTALEGKLDKTGVAAAATKASQDADGNPIKATYATKEELRNKQDKGDYLTTGTANTTYLKKTDAQTTYVSKTDATDTYLTKTAAATTYLGISSNAASATKATQDADGNNISATYAKKSELPVITSGTEDLTAGSSALATGSLYFMYE